MWELAMQQWASIGEQKNILLEKMVKAALYSKQNIAGSWNISQFHCII